MGQRGLGRTVTDHRLDWSSEDAVNLGRRLGIKGNGGGPSLRDDIARLLVDELRDDPLSAIAGADHPIDSRVVALLPGRSRNLLRRLAAAHDLSLDELPLGRFRASELLEYRQVGPQTVADIILAAHMLRDSPSTKHEDVTTQVEAETPTQHPEDTTRSLTERLAVPPGLDPKEMRYRVGTAVLNVYPLTRLSQLFPDVPRDVPVSLLPVFQRSKTVLAAWSRAKRIEATVEDLLTLTPGDVADFQSAGVATVGDICLALDVLDDSLMQNVVVAEQPPQIHTAIEAFEAIREVVQSLPEREVRIYALRHVRRRQRPTLEDIGREIDCTRERVRQIESKVHSKLSDAMSHVTELFDWSIPNGVVGWPTAVDALGFPPRPVPDWDAADETSHDEITQQVVLSRLHLEERSGYVAAKEAWLQLQETLSTVKEANGITIGMIRRRLESLVQPLDSEFLASLLTDSGLTLGSDGTIETKPKTQQEVVLRFFERAGQPLTRKQVIDGTGLAEGQVRGLLQRRGVFSWVGKGIFAPSSWGLPLYEGTEAALKEALKARGGTAPMAELTQEVVKRFGCTAVSCKTYLMSSVLFERQGGMVSLATGADRQIEPGNPARQRRVYSDLADGLVWSIDVDEDFLRGSGRGVPASVAAHLGATRFGETMLEAPGGALRIKRSGVGIQLSSMRKVGEACSAQPGDRFLLRLPVGADHRWDLVRRNETNPTECCLAMVGQPFSDPWTEVLAQACWQRDTSLWQETLWDRGETALLSLLELPLTDPRGTILDIAQLDQLLLQHGITRADVSRQADLPVYVFNEDAGEGLAKLTSVETTRVLRALEQLVDQSAGELHHALFRS
jgi:hypothetical protein